MPDRTQQLLELTRKVVDPRRVDELTADALLLETRMLDSFGLIQLVADIEQEFSVQLATEDLTFENFGSVNRIAALLDRSLDA